MAMVDVSSRMMQKEGAEGRQFDSILLPHSNCDLSPFAAAPVSHSTFLRFSGDSIVLWKQGERVLSAGPIQVRKDSRMSLVEAASLRIKDVDVADAGKRFRSYLV